jgi:hypothetical protein
MIACKANKSLARFFSFQGKDYFNVYAGSLFLSLKYLNDTIKWRVKDFSVVSGLSETLVANMELLVLTKGLDFKMIIKEKEFFSVKTNIQEILSSKPEMIQRMLKWISKY